MLLPWRICRLGGWQAHLMEGDLKWWVMGDRHCVEDVLGQPRLDGWTSVSLGSDCRGLPREAAWAGEGHDVSMCLGLNLFFGL